MSSSWLKILVFIWLLCNTFYHFQNTNLYYGHPYSASWTIYTKYIRFLEVTMLECFIGTIITALILKHFRKKALVFPSCNKKILAITVVGHLIGTLAINAAVSMHSLYVQDFLRSLEPVMVYILLMQHGSHNVRKSLYVFVGLILMAAGLQAFMRHQTLVFTQWGAVAAVLPVFMFPLRNICLKAFGETWKDPFEKYLMVSGCSFLFLVFAVLVKLAYTRILPLFSLEMALRSVVFHVVDSLISIFLLELFSPVFHSVLGIVIRYLTISFLALTYSSFSMSGLTTIGMLLFPTGLVIFIQKYNLSNTQEIRRFIISSVFALHLIFGGDLLWKLHFDAKSTAIKQTPKIVRSFWVYNQPLNENIFLNMQRSYLQRSTDKLHVFCGTFSCMKKLNSLKNPQISTTLLNFDAIARNSPLEQWFKAVVVHKILSGKYFEIHLHEAAKLALLWRYGGTIVDPFLQINEKTSWKLAGIREAYIAKITNHNSSEILYACNFKKRHPFVKMLLSIFAELYHRLCYLGQYCKTFIYNFHVQSAIALKDLCKNGNQNCPKIVEILAERTDHEVHSKHVDVTFKWMNTKSLSSGIQNFATIQFFPTGREVPGSYRNNGTLLQHGSGLFPQLKMLFHPPNTLAEILALGKDFSLKNLGSSLKFAPVGCFDMKTVDFLRSYKFEAYLSGGNGLLMKPPLGRSTSRNKIYIVGLNETLIDQFPKEIQDKGIHLSLGKKSELNIRSWIKSLHVFLKKIARAKLVITEDFSCASVALAFDTPVFYVQTQNASKQDLHSSQVFHTWNTVDGSFNSSHVALISKLLSGKIPAASDLSFFMRLRATHWSALRSNEIYRESALKFGVVPFARPRSKTVENNTFHLIFTTSERSLIVLEDVSGSGKVTGVFAWRHWRCLEAIFYHHPLATVIIHSNTLSPSVFDVLRETGYRIQVKPYNLTALAKGTPAEVFVQDELPYAKEGKHWYSHETDLLRLLVLYKYGGIYMDIDMIVVRQLRDLPLNVIGWESASNLNGAFLKFRRGHAYLRACIQRFSERYSQAWSENGPLLLSRVWREWSTANPDNDVITTSPTAFYMFFYRSIRQSCFEDTSGADFNRDWRILKSRAYAVHLYSKVTADYGSENYKIKEGTLCKYILNAFCVLCIKVY